MLKMLLMSQAHSLIDHRFRDTFPGYKIPVALLTAVVTVMAVLYQEWLALFVLPVGLGIITFRQGIQLQPDTQRYRHYFQTLGVKLGKWESYEGYPDLVMLHQRKDYEGRFPLNIIQNLRQSHTHYELYLASPRHFDLVLIDVQHDAQKAEQHARRLAQDLDLHYMRYNPGQRKQPVQA